MFISLIQGVYGAQYLNVDNLFCLFANIMASVVSTSKVIMVRIVTHESQMYFTNHKCICY